MKGERLILGLYNIKIEKLPLNIYTGITIRSPTKREKELFKDKEGRIKMSPELVIGIKLDCLLKNWPIRPTDPASEYLPIAKHDRFFNLLTFILKTWPISDSSNNKYPVYLLPFLRQFLFMRDQEWKATGSGISKEPFIILDKITTHLKKSDISSFKKYCKILIIAAKRSYIENAIKRYNKASWGDIADRIIDYTIALESLCVGGSDSIPGSISYKIALRTSMLAEDDPKLRQQVFDFIKKVYGIRSQLVHGTGHAKKTMKKISEFQSNGIFELRRVVRKSIFGAACINSGNLSKYLDNRILTATNMDFS